MGIDENECLSEFPKSIKSDILIYLYKSAIL